MRALIVIVALAISGCAAVKTKTPLLDKDGNVVTYTNILGMKRPVYTKERKTPTAVIAENARLAKVAASKADNDKTSACEKIMDKTPATAAGEAEQFRSYADCLRNDSTVALVGKALGRPSTDVEAITQGETQQQKAVQDGMTERLREGKKLFSDNVPYIVAGRFLEQNSKDRAKVAEKGFEEAGDIDSTVNISNTQSNDPSSTLAGGGEGSTSTGNTTADGDASIEDVNINVGRGDFNRATDNARVQSRTSNTQQLDSSATGLLIGDDSNTDQATAADENNGDQNNDPINGAGNTRTDEPTGPL